MNDLYFKCPHCGSQVSFARKNCPRCGSDDETGWSPMTIYDDLDLPEQTLEGRNFPGIKDTLFWKDIKWIVSLILFLAVLSLGLRW